MSRLMLLLVCAVVLVPLLFVATRRRKAIENPLTGWGNALAKIHQVDVVRHTQSRADHVVELAYLFTIGGKEIEGKAIAPINFLRCEQAQKYAERYPIGSELLVRYLLQDPSQSDPFSVHDQAASPGLAGRSRSKNALAA